MKAARVLRYGPPSVIEIDDVPRPSPGLGQLLVRVEAAGVGNWDALFREGESKLEPLPIILGSDIAGTVEALGAEVSGFKPGDQVYGSTNPQFSGGQAEYAVPLAGMIAPKPRTLNFIEAASVPVVAVTAWQMLFEYAGAVAGQTVLIHGAAGSVGAYAVQLARQAGLRIGATAGSADLDYVRGLGAERVFDYRKDRFEESVSGVDIVLDTVGGLTQEKSLRVLKRGGILVSIVSAVPDAAQEQLGIRAAFFYAEVTTARLNKITELIDGGKLSTGVGTVLPLEQVQVAHEMLAGAPHKRGKIVLTVSAP
jgi:NADPH:quinone reductase-like Zn-dependent oxidoreductase